MKQMSIDSSSPELARVCGGLGDPGHSSPSDPLDRPTYPIAVPPPLF